MVFFDLELEKSKRKQNKYWVGFLVVIILFLIIGVIVSLYSGNKSETNSSQYSRSTYSLNVGSVDIADATYFSDLQLQSYNGIDGNKCFVALEGIIYEIDSSNNVLQLSCGVDETSKISNIEDKEFFLNSLKKVAIYVK